MSSVGSAPFKTNDYARLNEAGHIRGFDGLRAIAFLLVFASHKIHFRHADSFGDVGVWLFFVLSGFLITRILARSRAEVDSGLTTAQASLGRFYLRRTARIFPPYYMLLAIFAAASLFVSIADFGKLEKLAYLFYGTNILVALRSHWVGDFGHFWSLAVEEQFYLLFAPLLLFLSSRNTMRACLGMVALGGITLISLEAGRYSTLSIDMNSFVNFAWIGLGGLIGLRVGLPVPKWLTSGAAQFAVMCFYLALPTAFGAKPEIWPLLGKLSTVIAGVLLFQIFNGQQSWFVATLESAPFQKIGRVSYGAYLVHHFIYFSTVEHLFSHFGIAISASRLVQVSIELAITLIIAAISWRYFEQPIIAWARRVTSRIPVSFVTPPVRAA